MRNNFFISETVEMLKYHKILEKVNSSIFISRCSFKNNSTFFYFFFHLTLSWRKPLSYRNHSIDLLCKSIDWFLYDNSLRQERVNAPPRIDASIYIRQWLPP